MTRISFLVCLLLVLSACEEAPQKRRKSLKGEKWYQALWCDEQNGRAEVPMEDRTRCDCLTTTHAIEVDFGRKWAEAIGQSLHYSRLTGKDAGILLILKDDKDQKYVTRMRDNISYFDLPITVWTIDAADYRKRPPAKEKGAIENVLATLKNFVCKLAAVSSFIESYCR